jgi:sugar lactone lactonase YvrE
MPGLFLSALVGLLPVVSQAQVTFTGAQASVSLGSQAVGKRSAAAALPFSIAANTTVGSIAVVTTGSAGRDFAEATGSTCAAGTSATATNCIVNVTFKPMATGLRLGAVEFFAGAHNSGAVLATVPVSGIGTGAQLVFGSSDGTSVGSGFLGLEAVAVDAAGNVYVPDAGLQKVFKITPAGKQTVIGSGLQVPQGVAVDGAGNVYIADSQAAAVFKVTPGGVQSTIGSGFSFPAAAAVDGAGNVYISDPFIPTVFKVTPSGTQTQVGNNYNTPAGVAVDSAGNVYVADTFNSVVFKVTPGGTQTTVGSGFISPNGVAVDAAGDLYVTDDATNTVIEVPTGAAQSAVVSGLDAPGGLALDGTGNLYVANTNTSQVMKINRTAAPSLSFAATAINHTSKDSPKVVEVENIGNSSLNFSALTYPADFPEATSGTNCTASVQVGPGGNCTLTINFSPVTPLGTNSSAVLTEAVQFTANKKVEQVSVTGKETK